VGPIPGSSSSGEINAEVQYLEDGEFGDESNAFGEVVTGRLEQQEAGHGVDTSAFRALGDIEAEEEAVTTVDKNTNAIVDEVMITVVTAADDKDVPGDTDETIVGITNGDENLLDPSTPQKRFDNRTNPRVPPNTPAKEDRIWWANELFAIKKSKLGGLGAFAAKDLKYGDRILEEMPILRTNSWGIYNEYDALSDEDRELFHSLHKFSANPTAHDIEKIRRANS